MRWGRAAGPLVVPGEGRGDRRETYQEVLQEREESGRFIARLRGWWEDVEVGGRGRSSSARAMGEVPSTPPPTRPSVQDLAQRSGPGPPTAQPPADAPHDPKPEEDPVRLVALCDPPR